VGLHENVGNEYTIAFEIADTAVGMNEEQQEKLFNPFEQADSSTARKYGGTGLGLAITKRILELMGGTISVSSKPGEGSTFTITIKTVKPNEETMKSLRIADKTDISNINILVVDDDEDILEYFLDIALRFNIPCDTALSGAEALELMDSGNKYDLFFVDWKMPEMDGIELSRRINEDKTDESVIIMISSAQWYDISETAKDAGVSGFLPKPIFPSDVLKCIYNFFGIDLMNEDNDSKAVDIDKFWGYRILLVEDVEINREIVMALLEPTQVDIDCAENGAEALRMFTESPKSYNLVFMDIQMPIMDGYEATRRIRASKADNASAIPTVAMTANVFNDDVRQCLEAGMDGHLGKPVDFDAVLKVLRKYLYMQKPVNERRKGDRRKSTRDRRHGDERRKGDRRSSE